MFILSMFSLPSQELLGLAYQKVVQGKCPPFISLFEWGHLLEHSFLEHFCLYQFSVIQANSTCKGSRTPRLVACFCQRRHDRLYAWSPPSQNHGLEPCSAPPQNHGPEILLCNHFYVLFFWPGAKAGSFRTMVLRGCRPWFRTMVLQGWEPCRYRRSCLLQFWVRGVANGGFPDMDS